MIITEFLEKNARITPDHVALVEVNPALQPDHSVSWREFNLIESSSGGKYRREITWREFDQTANRFANLLLSRGVKKGDKVAILLMNCLEWLPIYFGVLKTGALAVPLNYRYTADEISYCLALSDASVLIFGPEFTSRVEQSMDQLYGIRYFFYVGNDTPPFSDNFSHYITFCSSTAPAVEVMDRDDAAIYFSSGTTGFPKAILHSHEGLMAACLSEQKHHGQTKDDIFLCIPPLYHTGAKMHWFGSLMVGGKAILLRGISSKWVLQAVSDEKATIVWLLVPWAQDILDSLEKGELKLSDYKLKQWRLMHIGAQPVPPSLISRWLKVFPHQQYDTNYGLSESAGPGCVHLGVENVHKVGAIGKAGFQWETRIVDDQMRNVPIGTVGELAVKGPGLMKCYYRNQEATDEILIDGWLRTGDMAKMDEDGFIFLVDRKKDVIISGGENIYPVQIEDFLRAHDKIKDVAVIGMSDDRLGEIAAAIIELKTEGSMNEEDVHNFCLDLPRYKRPRKIIFAKVPRNLTGKIEKPKLRQIYGAEHLVEKQVTK
jgi:long-chain acyl-CoA synthetase